MNRSFRIWFTNVTGCAAGMSDISLFVDVVAESEAEAMEKAIVEARAVNERTGLPPHGLKVDDAYLRTLATAVAPNCCDEAS